MTAQGTTHGRQLLLRVLAVLGLALGGLGLLGAPAHAAVGDEKMTDFTATYDIQPDGSMEVTEEITYQFPSGQQRRGILRNITTRMGWKNEAGKVRVYTMADVSATSPTGAPSDVSVSQFGASDQIKVGDPDRTTSGTQKYVLRYTLRNVLNPQTDTNELYYNVFGAAETIPREKVSITVKSPSGVTESKCTTGSTGAETPCQATNGNPATFTASNLGPGQAMTIAASMPKTGFSDVQADVRNGTVDDGGGFAEGVSPLGISGGVGAPLLALLGLGFLVRTRGRDEHYADLTPGLSPVPAPVGPDGRPLDGGAPVTRRGDAGTVAVQFTPPPGVTPGLVGTVIDEKADPVDVSATVIDLAVRGYLTIEELKGSGMFSRTDWIMERQPDPPNDQLRAYERTVLDGIFDSGNRVQLSHLKNHFADTLKSVQSQMYDETVALGWFRKSPEATRSMWQVLGGAIAIGGGYLLWNSQNGSHFGINDKAALGGGILLAGIIVMLLGARMVARTAAGSAVNMQARGFKEYLVRAEADQIAFDEASMIFSRYLPYAVVYGVADRWAQTFAKVAQAAQASGYMLSYPSWYIYAGGGVPDFTSIADGADAFSTTSTGTFTSTPGSSGSSAFGSGGSFSVGGGGGGSSSGSW